MATDEQILAKTTALLDILQEKCWPGYEKKGMKKMFGKMYPNCVKKSKKKKRKKRKNEEVELYEEKVLREITEDEMRVLDDVLDDLDPTRLPLNDLFGGKMRTIIPFPTMDTESELGQFAKMLDQEFELQVDWEKGIVSAQREWTENSIENDENFVSSLSDYGTPQKKVNKKFQMKIGKYFMKLDKLLRDFKEMRQIVAKHVYEKPNSASWSVNFSVGQIQKALTTEQLKRLYQIMNGLELYAGTASMGFLSKYYGGYEDAQAGKVTKMPKSAKYWQQNAGYIKNEIKNITNDKYSIIITRHPIDVLRMSDFDNITSCHSPASRTSAYQSYYKCAVAEAQGHGAVAYVVETEDIVKWSGRSDMSMDEIEEEMQDGEIFYDDKRQYAGTIEPISRSRIRHVRYYDTDAPKRYDDGIDVGMPETRIYGAGIPGILNRVTDWARQNQKEVIENMPKNDNNIIDLNRFMIFGGSYEDTANAAGREKLMRQLLGPEALVSGNMKQNTDTEDNLDADLIGDIVQQYENYCSGRTDYWNNHMAACEVEYNVEDDGDGGVYIAVGAKIQIEWEASDWNSLPNAVNRAVMYSPDVINEIYGDLLKTDGAYLQRTRNRRGEDLIVWHCDIEPEHPELGGRFLALDEEYEEFCAAVDTIIDDKRDAFKEILTNYFAREGFMQGGEYINFAVDVENGEVSSYEWDVETDGDYEDSYETYASYSFDYDVEEFKMNEDVLKDILNSRDYKIQLRRNLLQEPQQTVNTDYFLSMKAFANKYVEGELRVTVTFSVNRDEPDEMVTLFKELVEGDMDDEDNLTVVFNKTFAQIASTINSGQFPEQESPATAGLNETLVKVWKDYIRV